jgi:hypothetical protein
MTIRTGSAGPASPAGAPPAHLRCVTGMVLGASTCSRTWLCWGTSRCWMPVPPPSASPNEL